jgi:23S rRNA (cytosine1962-C5)-methyltransferase
MAKINKVKRTSKIILFVILWIQFHFHNYRSYFCTSLHCKLFYLEERNPLFNRVKKNLKQLKPYLVKHQISCYRAFDWDMPEYPLCIDVYEQQIHVAEYKTKNQLSEMESKQWLISCIATIKEIFNVGDNEIFIKQRERQKGDNQYQKVNEVKKFTPVQENGINFLVNLHDYLDTGLFLDHRITRKMVMDESRGKHVLNLFAYTGSFSVYAAMGGAFTTTTVDLSNIYLNWAKENFKANNIPLAKHSFIKNDVKEWIKQAPSKLYDIIVLDPPTVSTSNLMHSKFDVQHDHVELINNTLNHLKSNGIIYFSNNFRNFQFQPELIKASSIDDIRLKTIPDDYRNKKIHSCWRIIK